MLHLFHNRLSTNEKTPFEIRQRSAVLLVDFWTKSRNHEIPDSIAVQNRQNFRVLGVKR